MAPAEILHFADGLRIGDGGTHLKRGTRMFFRGDSGGASKDLTVEVTDSGEYPAWFISHIVVRNVSTGESAYFFAHKWLGKDNKNQDDDPWKLPLVVQSEESVSQQLTDALMPVYQIMIAQ